jgi:hypothetical protein
MADKKEAKKEVKKESKVEYASSDGLKVGINHKPDVEVKK